MTSEPADLAGHREAFCITVRETEIPESENCPDLLAVACSRSLLLSSQLVNKFWSKLQPVNVGLSLYEVFASGAERFQTHQIAF